jgi:hypothetical protein
MDVEKLSGQMETIPVPHQTGVAGIRIPPRILEVSDDLHRFRVRHFRRLWVIGGAVGSTPSVIGEELVDFVRLVRSGLFYFFITRLRVPCEGSQCHSSWLGTCPTDL